jgi:hypothetical protein
MRVLNDELEMLPGPLEPRLQEPRDGRQAMVKGLVTDLLYRAQVYSPLLLCGSA